MLTRVIYTAEPGETLKLLRSGLTLIVHPDKPPRILHPDGKIELFEAVQTVMLDARDALNR